MASFKGLLNTPAKVDKKLKDLLKQKRQILENVMNTETYNKAQQILKQFDPLGLIVRDFSIDRPITKMEFETTARQRNVPNNKNVPCTPKPVPTATQIPTCQNPTTTAQTPTPSQPPKGPITHRPILPRERSILDIVVDAIVGDGPGRRYALICQNCSGHNGMALAEEFEYLGKCLDVVTLNCYGILTITVLSYISSFGFYYQLNSSPKATASFDQMVFIDILHCSCYCLHKREGLGVMGCLLTSFLITPRPTRNNRNN
ncbi:hypothetical protein ACTXT7_007526 [Hymenolepis weldensis]